MPYFKRGNSEKNNANFEAEKNLIKNEFSNILEKFKSEVDTKKVLRIFDESLGKNQKEKTRRSRRSLILKDKGNGRRKKEKFKYYDGFWGNYLKIKDKNTGDRLKINLKSGKVEKNIGFKLDLITNEDKHSFHQGEESSVNLKNYILKNNKEEAVTEYRISRLSNRSLGAKIDYKTGEISFSPNTPVGNYYIDWQAKTPDGWSRKTKLEVIVLPKKIVEEIIPEISPEIIPDDNENNENEEDKIDKSREKFELSLADLKNKVNKVENPTLGTPDGYNLDQVEGPLVAAEKALAALEGNAEFAEFRKNNETLDSLKKNIIVLREKLDSLQKQKVEKIAKRDENIKNEIEKIKTQTAEEKQQKAELDKVEQEMKDAQAEIAKNQADFAAKSAASFEAIKKGEWNIESETSFDPGNLNSLEGVNHEMQKHDYEVQKFKAEMSYMNQGIAGMEQKFTEFEAKKDEFRLGKNLGSLGVVGGAAAGAGLLGTSLASGILPAAALGAGVFEMGRNVVGAGWKRLYKWWNKKPLPVDSWAYGTMLGMFTGENEEAREQQTEKLKFEEKYKEYSAKLQTKEAKLKSDGDQIRSAASDPSELMSKRADDVVKESNIAEKITNLYKEVGQEREIPANLIKDSEKAVKDEIRENLEPLATSLQAAGTKSLTDDAEIIAGVNSAKLLSSEQELANREFRADDIFTATLGRAGKKLKGWSDDVRESVPFAGGVLNFAGNMVEGVGSLASRPDKAINGITSLVGFDFSKDNPWAEYGMPFSILSPTAIGRSWSGVGNFLIATESWEEAKLAKTGEEKFSAYANALTETILNIATIPFALDKLGKAGRLGKIAEGIASGKNRFGAVGRGTKIFLEKDAWKAGGKGIAETSGKIWKGTGGKSKGFFKKLWEKRPFRKKPKGNIAKISKKTSLKNLESSLKKAETEFHQAHTDWVKTKTKSNVAGDAAKRSEMLAKQKNLQDIVKKIDEKSAKIKKSQDKFDKHNGNYKPEGEPWYKPWAKLKNQRAKMRANKHGKDLAKYKGADDFVLDTDLYNRTKNIAGKSIKEIEVYDVAAIKKAEIAKNIKAWKAEIKDFQTKLSKAELELIDLQDVLEKAKKKKNGGLTQATENLNNKVKEISGLKRNIEVRDRLTKRAKGDKGYLNPAKNSTVESATESVTESVNSKKHLIPKWKKENILFKKKLTEMKTSLESYKKMKLENIKKNKSVDKIQVEIDRIAKEMERTEKKIVYRETKLELYDN